MILMVCVDDNGGMLFNERRQSRDRVLRQHMMKRCGEQGLRMNAYSARQFGEDFPGKLRIDEDFAEKAGTGEYCFAENIDFAPYADKIEKIILYKWNRVYPADFFFAWPGGPEVWKPAGTAEFEGSSHEKITEEIYIK